MYYNIFFRNNLSKEHILYLICSNKYINKIIKRNIERFIKEKF